MIYRADVVIVGAGPAGSTAAKMLAAQGYKVSLLDRAVFPRHKTCASWINRLAFERFPYLTPRLTDLVEAPFYGVTFFDASLKREGKFREPEPCGYLSLRSKLDDGLRRIAVEAGAEFHGACPVVNVVQDSQEVKAITAAEDIFLGRVLVGADGSSSRVAMAAGLRRGWGARGYVLCGNADIPCSPETIKCFYGGQFPFRVYLAYHMLPGYGWIFPKRAHICVGIGAMLSDNRQIRPLLAEFFREAQERGHLPPKFRLEGEHFDVDPVGAVHQLPTLTRGRVLLIGDAAGFVSGSTGEGIYPGMVSAEIAARVIDKALKDGGVERVLEQFNQAWRPELASYVRRLPGGDVESSTRRRIDFIFRSSFVARVAGRIFLYGERPSMRTLARCVWPA
jgi:geranylgeranyl reductase family protein